MHQSTLCLKIIILWLSLITVALSFGIVFIYLEFKNDHAENTQAVTSFRACADERFTINPHLKDNKGVFHELNTFEIEKIENYLRIKENVTVPTKLLFRKNKNKYILLIDVLHPKKQQVLDYRDKNGFKPMRRARVFVISDIDEIVEYHVWPTDKPSKHKQIQTTTYNIAQLYTIRTRFAMSALIINGLKKLWPLYRVTFEAFQNFSAAVELISNSFKWQTLDFNSKVDRKGKYIGVYISRDTNDITYIQKYTMLYYVINVTSQSQQEWTISQVIYNKVTFSGVDELLAAYKNKTLSLVHVPIVSITDKQLHKRSDNTYNLREPTMYSPNGPRFSIEGRTISYFDWRFEYGVQTLTGPGIYDVHFQNKRIAYEVSLKEFASFYSSAGPYVSSGTILHTFSGLGKTTSLIPGIDCPVHAVYLDSVSYFKKYTNYERQQSLVTKNSICVFEKNDGFPLRRHKTNRMYGGMSDNALVIRFILDIENSHVDVIYDYIFYQNGVIEVKATVTGFPLVNYKFEAVPNGYELYRNHVGIVHDNFMLYKVDLDIDGAPNSFKTLKTKLALHQDEWDTEPVLKKKLYENDHNRELGLRENNPHDYFVVYNKDKTNRFRNNRGYRIQIISSNDQLYSDKQIATVQAEWTKYKIAVTKHNDEEKDGSCILNSLNQNSPPGCSFDQRLNNESISNKDIVAWITIGGVQIPTTEDFPTVTTTGNQYSFLLRPFNYFNEDPSMDADNSVFVKKQKNKNKVFTYGISSETTCSAPVKKFV